ncbi:MAG: polyamine aminopropyltransferase [Candidatus Methanomethylicia archaeon]|nr:polyamine aminopropyltransferase [Candidatus Methanomethylicia archaeon]
MKLDEYYFEKTSPTTYKALKVKKRIAYKQSKHQKIEIIEFEELGKCLILDNLIQISELDEHLYHEMHVHPPLISHEKPEKVLIIGGGDGGVLREVLKHNVVKKVELVEIDEDVIKIVKEYIPNVPSGAFEDPRVKIVIEDGKKFIEKTQEKFDAVLMDLTDPEPTGPSIELYRSEFFKKVKRIMKEDGILLTQTSGYEMYPRIILDIQKTLKELFKNVGIYASYLPAFGGEWTFTYASDTVDIFGLNLLEIEKRYRERGIKTRYYTPELHYSLKYSMKSLLAKIQLIAESRR